MNPSIPQQPNLNDPQFAGAVDLDKVRADAAADKAAREQAAMTQAEEFSRRWVKGMNKTFKGICGASSLDRRFRMRAHLKRLEREAENV